MNGETRTAGPTVGKESQPPDDNGTSAPSSGTEQATETGDIRAETPFDNPNTRADLPPRDMRRYRFEGEHGRGGLGRVLKAYDTQLERTVAIKEMLQPDSAEERFIREAKITAQLEHPGIVPLYDAGRWPGGDPFYAMKLVSGRSLKDRIAAARSHKERFALLTHVLAVADAIAYAHSKGIIHRDLKPSNIIIGDYGETIVIDWGIAKDLNRECDASESSPYRSHADQALTSAGDVLGTPAYMPPEQACGGTVDKRADVYALGAILYQVLVGQSPHATPVTSRRPKTGPAADIHARHPTIPRDLIAIIDKAMSFDPGRRYQTAKSFADDLRRFQDGKLVEAHQYSPASLVRRWIARYRALVLTAGAAVVVLATMAALSVNSIVDERNRLVLANAASSLEINPSVALDHLLRYTGGESDRARDIAADAFARGVPKHLRSFGSMVTSVAFIDDRFLLAQVRANVTGIYDIKSETWRDIDHHIGWKDVALSRRHDAFVSRHTSGGTSVVRIADGHVAALEIPGYVADARFIGPDRVITTHGDGGLAVWQATTGNLETRLFESDQFIRIDVSADESFVATCDTHGSLIIRDLATWRSIATTTCAPSSTIGNVSGFSPDGRYYLSNSTTSRMPLVDIRSGNSYQFAGQSPHRKVAAFSPDSTLLAIGSIDGDVRIFELSTFKLVATMQHSSPVTRIRWAPNENVLASAHVSGGLRLWQPGGHVRSLRGHSRAIRSLAFSSDGERLVTGDRAGNVKLWQIPRAKTRKLTDFAPPAMQISTSPTGRFAAVLDTNNRIHIVDTRGGQQRVLQTHGVQGPLLFLDDETLFYIETHHKLRALPPGSNAPNQFVDFGHHHEDITAIEKIAADTIAIAITNGDLYSWRLGAGKPTRMARFAHRIVDLQGDQSTATVGVLLANGEIHLCGVISGTPTTVGRLDGARRLLWTSPAAAIVTDHSGIHRLQNGVTTTIYSADKAVRFAVHAQEAPLVAFAQDDSTYALNYNTGNRYRISGFGSAVVSIALSEAGRYLAAGREDGSVAVLDLKDRTVRIHHEHSRPVYHIDFLGQNRALVTAGYDMSLRAWGFSHARSQGLWNYAPDETHLGDF